MDESNSQTKPAFSLMTRMLSIVTRIHRAQLLRLPLQKMAQFIPLKMATSIKLKEIGASEWELRVTTVDHWIACRSNDHQTGSYTWCSKGTYKSLSRKDSDRSHSFDALWSEWLFRSFQSIGACEIDLSSATCTSVQGITPLAVAV